jgi:hypothetical protein
MRHEQGPVMALVVFSYNPKVCYQTVLTYLKNIKAAPSDNTDYIIRRKDHARPCDGCAAF